LGKGEVATNAVILVQVITEQYRLNFQHNYIIKCQSGLLQPGIPAEEIHSIADVGCGTGIWLEDMSKPGALPPTSDGVERAYHGFDISPALFPPLSERGKVKYHIVNILDPIPEEFKERFDLVHVQLLILAIKTVDLRTALRNIERLMSKTDSCFGDYLLILCIEQAGTSVG
jgi:SAM-dependent methyltransferase